jgi:hypothetical protein
MIQKEISMESSFVTPNEVLYIPEVNVKQNLNTLLHSCSFTRLFASSICNSCDTRLYKLQKLIPIANVILTIHIVQAS